MWLIGDLARMLSYMDKQMRKNSFAGETGKEVNGKHLGIYWFWQYRQKGCSDCLIWIQYESPWIWPVL